MRAGGREDRPYLRADQTVQAAAKPRKYARKYGKSWELDALDPEVLEDVLESHILKYLNKSLYNRTLAKERRERKALERMAKTI